MSSTGWKVRAQTLGPGHPGSDPGPTVSICRTLGTALDHSHVPQFPHLKKWVTSCPVHPSMVLKMGWGVSMHRPVLCLLEGLPRPPPMGSSTGAKSKVIGPCQCPEPQNHFISFQNPGHVGETEATQSHLVKTTGSGTRLPLTFYNLGQVL